MPFFKTPLEKEWAALLRREAKLRAERAEVSDSKLTEFLSTRVPEGLRSTLDAGFARAFGAIFDKGTPLIELTYNKKSREKAHEVNSYADSLYESRKTLRAFKKKADSAVGSSTLISGAAGVGMGLFGIGIPDIPLFVGMLLRCVYQVATDFGCDYDTPEERLFVLTLIEAGIAGSDGFLEADRRVDELIYPRANGAPIIDERDIAEQIPKTSAMLSGELLYMKFLQGVPIVGAIGGAYDAIYLKRVGDYAKLKYHKRFLLEKLRNIK